MRALIGALLLASGSAYAQPAEDVFAERVFALALDDRCGWFEPAERAALDAARLQARGALLRSGAEASVIEAFSDRVMRRSAGLPCDGEDILALAAGVRSAFAAYRYIPSMAFPGEARTWRAERPRGAETLWPLVQMLEDGPAAALFGVAARPEGLALALSRAAPQSGRPAAAAVLSLRDPDRSGLYDPTLGGLIAAGTPDWTRWTPPPGRERRYWARERQFENESQRVLYLFDTDARDALAALDPREAARIDLIDGQGRTVESHYIEVGDFAAALAFLAAGAAPQDSAGLRR